MGFQKSGGYTVPLVLVAESAQADTPQPSLQHNLKN